MSEVTLILQNKLHTNELHNYSVKFCPFAASILTTSGATNFGLKGSGSLICYNFANKQFIKKFDYKDAIFDHSWSKRNPDIILSASGDGCIQIWSFNKSLQNPVASAKIHMKEVSSIECAYFEEEYFITSSWDSSVKLCDMTGGPKVVCEMLGHKGMVNEAIWSKSVGGRTLASVSEDGRWLLWNPFERPTPMMEGGGKTADLLTCDWIASAQPMIVTGGVDATINGWDLRAPQAPLFKLSGHENAVRKVRASPFIENEITSVSYDFTTRLWDSRPGGKSSISQLHSEFVFGVDYSHLAPGLVADCSWDHSVAIYAIGKTLLPNYGVNIPSSSNHTKFVPRTRPLPVPPEHHRYLPEVPLTPKL